MSNKNNNKKNGRSPKIDLKLNLSQLPRVTPAEDDDADDNSPSRMSTSSEQSLTSAPSSCVSSEKNSPEGSKSMVLAGCSRCLMYMMLTEDEELKCPKCHNPVLLNFN